MSSIPTTCCAGRWVTGDDGKRCGPDGARGGDPVAHKWRNSSGRLNDYPECHGDQWGNVYQCDVLCSARSVDSSGGTALSSARVLISRQYLLVAVNIAVLAVDNSGNVYSNSVTVNILPTASLTSIQINPGLVQMSSSGEQQPLLVTGNYSDGIVRDITSASAGTTYTTQSGSNLVVAADR